MMSLFGYGAGVGMEIGHNVVRLAVVRKKGGAHADKLQGFSLPPGLLNESFGEPNVSDPDELAKVLSNAVGAVGGNRKNVRVALPDFIFRVVVLDFDTLPKKSEETEAVIRLRLKKLIPFDIGEAVVRYQYLGNFRERDSQKHRFLVTLIKGSVLSQYERCFEKAGLRPTHIGVSSLLVWNLYHDIIKREAGERDNYALMTVSGKRMSVIVLDRGVPRFFRLKDLGLEEGYTEGGAPVSMSVLRELGASLTFYRENFSAGPVELVYVSCSDETLRGIRESFGDESAFDVRPLPIDEAVSVKGAAGASGDELFKYNAACAAALEK